MLFMPFCGSQKPPWNPVPGREEILRQQDLGGSSSWCGRGRGKIMLSRQKCLCLKKHLNPSLCVFDEKLSSSYLLPSIYHLLAPVVHIHHSWNLLILFLHIWMPVPSLSRTPIFLPTFQYNFNIFSLSFNIRYGIWLSKIANMKDLSSLSERAFTQARIYLSVYINKIGETSKNICGIYPVSELNEMLLKFIPRNYFVKTWRQLYEDYIRQETSLTVTLVTKENSCLGWRQAVPSAQHATLTCQCNPFLPSDISWIQCLANINPYLWWSATVSAQHVIRPHWSQHRLYFSIY